MVEKETCKSEGGKEGILDSIEMERGENSEMGEGSYFNHTFKYIVLIY